MKLEDAKRLLLEVVAERQKEIVGIKGADPALKISYAKMCEDLQNKRGFALWHPYIGTGVGKGSFVQLADGSVKLDFVTGVGVHFAHCHPKILDATIEACLSNMVMQGNLMQNREIKELTDLLLKASGMPHVFITTSGSMACENALKIIFQKKAPARRLFAFEHCFMGRTYTLAQVTDKPAFRMGLPLNLSVDYLPFSNESVKVMQKAIERYPKEHAALCIELVQGEGGFWVAENSFIEPLVALAKAHQIPLFIDEVQTFGRGPKLFAFQDFGIQPDLVTVGKLSQVCATFFSDDFVPKPGLLSQTFTGSTTAIAASKVIIEELLQNGQKRVEIGNYFRKKLEGIKGIQGPFGYGTMVAFTPCSGNKEKVYAFAKALFEKGLITFIAGENPTRIRMLPPIGSVTFEEIDLAIALIKDTL